ncbi:hypothetical protein JMJ77_0009243 [Colletotrichum scovillei]|uniref:Uncharacterized protein n=1 Tax=Colletotrichum scovillei TaxID=1209932 RepID=A0A9P7R1N9_9PEZI|nr:hypothetical protein JMJ77_0009243 [Colletotrichum scovillei]KAG7052318.1 hypothetical protein JMJ78_0005338 [Colletotrichum scovillei]KAG7064610.1 hypothetical protein JMJ76_0012372 [Colletotrichum scovillei]
MRPHLDSRKSLHNKYGIQVEEFAASVALGTEFRGSAASRSAAEAWPQRVTRIALCEVEGRYAQIVSIVKKN